MPYDRRYMILLKHLEKASDATWRSLVGVSKSEFYLLLPVFGKAWYTYLATKHNRKRKPGAGIKGVLPTDEHKLFFGLMYLKHYPYLAAMGFMFGTDKTRAHKWVHKIIPIIKTSLHFSGHLPARRVKTPEEFFQLVPGLKDVFIDGTERRTRRPKEQRRQRKLYSGKTKAHTRKTIVLSDEHQKIVMLTPSHSGRRHDKRLADKDMLFSTIPDSVTVWADTGFHGIQHLHPNSCLPKKGTKKNPLTPIEKEENHVITSFRSVVEHAIRGFKRFRAASDVYRNRKINFDDLLTEVSAGLWNLHLAQG